MNTETQGTQGTQGTENQTITATAALVGGMKTSGRAAQRHAVGFLLGYIPAAALAAEVDKARIRVAADIKSGRLTHAMGAALTAYGVAAMGHLCAIMALTPEAANAERAECLAAWGDITEEQRINAVANALEYTTLHPLMMALAAVGEKPVNTGLDYIKGQLHLITDLSALADAMGEYVERMPAGAVDACRADVENLRAAIRGVSALPEAEQARERALWCEAIEAGRVKIIDTDPAAQLERALAELIQRRTR